MNTRLCCRLLVLIWVQLGDVSTDNVVHMNQDFPEIKDSVETASPEKPKKEFSFASYYGDHMVLQRAPQRATVWGYHPDPGSHIIIQVKDQKIYSAVVDENGIWKVLLEPESRTKHFVIIAHSETKTIRLKDVLFGDVWLCSGQSNMAFTLDAAFNGSKEIREARKFQEIRVFTANKRYSKQPLSDLESVLEKWSLPSKASLGHRWQYFSAICWLYGKYLYQQLGYPIGLVTTAWGGTPIESWMSDRALKECGLTPQGTNEASLNVLDGNGIGMDSSGASPLTSDQSHGELWNAMINPFLPMTIYGVIWDQGESDDNPVNYRNNYNCTFPAMIDDWRRKFSAASGGQTKPDFPFGFVQIGACFKDVVRSSGFPDIRWHQTADYGYVPNPRMKNVFMSVSMDIADFDSPFGAVHTRDKQDITHRLFLGGMNIAYGRDTFWQGPLPMHVTQSGETLILDYGRKWKLELRQREGFELCCSLNGSKSCEPGKAWWVPTPVMTSNTTHIELYAGVCGKEQNILGLRYAWRLSPCPFKQCTVYSMENNLPAPPFVTNIKIFRPWKNASFLLDWTKPVHL